MAKVFLLIVVGLAGEPEHGELFAKWGSALAEASARMGVPAERLVYLADPPAEGEKDKRITGRPTKAEVTSALASIAKTAAPDDTVFVMLIGHGTSDGKDPKFNLTGPDMTASEFAPLIGKLPSKQIVFVNTSSSSGQFVQALSGPGRTIVTATRNDAEKYATLFGGPFIEALTSEAADADKNKRVTVLEAFNYARAEVERSYKREGLLMTEHALLDDDGDKEGTQAPGPTTKDGKMASVLSIGSFDGSATVNDPKLAALIAERREMERRVESLRLLKEGMEPARYTAELEKLLTELAQKAREIRAVEEALKK
jgi:hypothetical protein